MATVPTEPLIYIRPRVASQEIQFYWQPPSSDGGSSIQSYTLECSAISFSQVLADTDRTYTVTGLTNGTPHTFTLKATNSVGDSPLATYRTVIPGNRPEPPNNISVSVEANSNIIVNWSNISPTENIIRNLVTLYPIESSGNTIKNTAFTSKKVTYGNQNYRQINIPNTGYDYKAVIQSIGDAGWSTDKNFSKSFNNFVITNGLKLWLDASDSDTINLGINNLVLEWKDKSVNLANAIANVSPTYDFVNKYLVFDGIQSFNLPDNTIPSVDTDYSIFLNMSTDFSNISNYQQFFLYSGTDASNESLGFYVNYDGNIGQSWYDSNLNGNIMINNYQTNLVEFTYTSGSRNTYINGTLIASDSVTGRNSATSNNIIGMRPGNIHGLVGTISDILIYDRVLNDSERQGIEFYLKNKKNILNITNIGSVNLWLDASDRNTLYDQTISNKAEANANVYVWIDKSNPTITVTANLDINVSVPSRLVGYQNGLDVLDFNRGFYNSNIAGYYPADVFFVLKLKDLTTNVDLFGISSAGSDNFNSLVFSFNTTSRWENGSDTNTRTPDTISKKDEVSTDFIIIEWSIEDNNFIIRRFGEILSKTSSYTWTVPNDTEILIGLRKWLNGNSAFSGYLGEVVSFNKILNTDERFKVEGILAWKWGLVNNLPYGHPYKFYPPLKNDFYNNQWKPNRIDNLALWLDSSDSNTLEITESNVASWKDKSPANVFFQAVSMPNISNVKLNGLNGIQFDGQSYFQNDTMPFNLSNYTLFLVCQEIDQYSTHVGYLSFANVNTGHDYDQVDALSIVASNNQHILNVSSASSNSGYVLDVNGTGPTPIGLYSINNFNNSANIFYNGNIVDTASPSATFFPSTGLIIGARFQFGTVSQSLNGVIYEVIGYETQLSNIERQNVEGYLMRKWGLQSKLDSAHPYRNIYPITDIESNIFFDPYSISGMNLWVDATDANTLIDFDGNIVLNEQFVYNIIDKSNSNNTLAPLDIANAVVRKPNYFNGLDVLEFNKNVLKSISAVYPFDAFIVFRLKSLVNYSEIFSLDQGSSEFTSLAYSFFSNYQWYNGSSFGNRYFDSGNNLESSLKFLLMEYSLADNNFFIRRYGSNIANNNSFTISYSSGNFVIGDSGYNGGLLDGYIAEMIVYNSQLNNTDRENVEGYLAWKWNIANSLPELHPYKNTPPTANISQPPPPQPTESIFFYPSMIDNMMLWLDASDANATTFIDSNLYIMTDKSIKNNTPQNNSGFPPTMSNINGIRSLNFDSLVNPQNLNGNLDMAYSDYFTFVIVGTMANSQVIANPRIISLGDNTTNFEIQSGIIIKGATNQAIAVYDNSLGGGDPTGFGGNWNLYDPIPNYDEPYIYILKYNTNNVKSYINGTYGSVSAGIGTNRTANVFGIGCNPFNPTFNLDSYVGNISEVIIYNYDLNDTDRQLLEGTLAHKWNMTSLLPANHPYKTNNASNVFVPSMVSNLYLWLDAADPYGNSHIPSNLEVINTWYDKSGQNNHAINGSPPIYVSETQTLGFLNFDGANNYYELTNGSFLVNENFTCFVVERLQGITGSNQMMIGTDSSGSGLDTHVFYYSGTNADTIRWDFWGDNMGQNITAFTDIASQPTRLWTNQLYTGHKSTYLNSSNIIATADDSKLVSWTTPRIGRSVYDAGGSYYYGHLKEILIYKGIMMDADRLRVEGYLANKWNISNQLSNVHPYVTNNNPVMIKVKPYTVTDIDNLGNAPGGDIFTTIDGSFLTQWNPLHPNLGNPPATFPAGFKFLQEVEIKYIRVYCNSIGDTAHLITGITVYKGTNNTGTQLFEKLNMVDADFSFDYLNNLYFYQVEITNPQPLYECALYFDKTTAYQIYITEVEFYTVKQPVISTINTNGLVVWFDGPTYSGSGDWLNKVGNGIDASLTAGTATKNIGIDFDGSTYWTFPNPGSLTNWTVSVWVKRTTSSFGVTAAAIIAEDNINLNNTVNFRIATVNGSDLQGAFFDGTNWNPSNFFVTFIQNEWKHMVISWNGTGLKTYVNGILKDTTNLNATSSGSGNFYIGRRWDQDDRITAEIGEILVYNRALQDSEILKNYNTTYKNYY